MPNTPQTATIVTMMKDEGPFLLEWLAFHRVIGFDNICVYFNDCSDGTAQMLERLEQMGQLRAFANQVPEGKKPQPHALTLAQKNPAITQSEWVLVMDADEFVHIKTGAGHLSDLLHALPDKTDAIAMTWRIMGSSGIIDWSPGLVSEHYHRGASDGFRKGWGVKTMFRPFAHMKFGIHRPSIKQRKQNPDREAALLAQNWVNGAGRPLTRRFKSSAWRSSTHTIGYDLVEMNHYATRSIESFLLRDLRGNVNNKIGKYDPAYFAIFDRNEESHTGVQRHLPKVKEQIASYLADPVLRDLQTRANAFHQDRLDRLKAKPDYGARVQALRDAGATALQDLEKVLYTQSLPPEAKQQVAELKARGASDAQIAQLIAHSPLIAQIERETDEADAAEYAALGIALNRS